LEEGRVYKYRIKSYENNYVVDKADPFGFFSEMRPKTASIVADLDSYVWGDTEWTSTGQAKSNNFQGAPISIYEVHLGSWRRKWGAPGHDESLMEYRQIADELVAYVKELGYTHIELLPVSEHPFDGSWGYQTTGYYAVTSRFGKPQDFMYLVDLCHQNNIGIILDWVPAHFPKDEYGLGFFDGTHLYEHADPRQGEHLDWGTFIFNFGRNEVRNFLLSNALFWLDKYHIDGLRVDAVASLLYLDYSRPEGAWVPNKYGGRENLEAIDFLKRFNEQVHAEYPAIITAAEDSTAWPMVTKPTYMGGLGFDLKWNMGWMHDMLRYMEQDPIYRRYHHNDLTFSMLYAFNEDFILPISHDEVVHLKHSLVNKMPGDVWQKFANLRVFYTYMYCHPGKKLLFMGGEFAQWEEWNERGALNWDLLGYPSHQGMKQLNADLNHLYVNEASLHEIDDSWEGFDWIEVRDNENSVVAFIRRGRDRDDALIVCCNFTPVVRNNYRIGVPRHGYYNEVFNSDAGEYWGSGVGNYGGIHSDENYAWGGQPHSLSLTIPALSGVILRVPR
jgi:1,4-alpha-glucan branching enzyme